MNNEHNTAQAIKHLFDIDHPNARNIDERLIARMLPYVEQLRAGTLAGFEFLQIMEELNLRGNENVDIELSVYKR